MTRDQQQAEQVEVTNAELADQLDAFIVRDDAGRFFVPYNMIPSGETIALAAERLRLSSLRSVSAAEGVETQSGLLQIALVTLSRCKRMINEALPQFNWGASALSADAIKLLNDVPFEVNRALKTALDSTPPLPGASLPPSTEGAAMRDDAEREVVAWVYELATVIGLQTGYGKWSPSLSFVKPNVPEGSIRNLRPLFAEPGAVARREDGAARAVLTSIADSLAVAEREGVQAFSLMLTGDEARALAALAQAPTEQEASNG